MLASLGPAYLQPLSGGRFLLFGSWQDEGPLQDQGPGYRRESLSSQYNPALQSQPLMVQHLLSTVLLWTVAY